MLGLRPLAQPAFCPRLPASPCRLARRLDIGDLGIDLSVLSACQSSRPPASRLRPWLPVRRGPFVSSTFIHAYCRVLQGGPRGNSRMRRFHLRWHQSSYEKKLPLPSFGVLNATWHVPNRRCIDSIGFEHWREQGGEVRMTAFCVGATIDDVVSNQSRFSERPYARVSRRQVAVTGFSAWLGLGPGAYY